MGFFSLRRAAEDFGGLERTSLRDVGKFKIWFTGSGVYGLEFGVF